MKFSMGTSSEKRSGLKQNDSFKPSIHFCPKLILVQYEGKQGSKANFICTNILHVTYCANVWIAPLRRTLEVMD